MEGILNIVSREDSGRQCVAKRCGIMRAGQELDQMGSLAEGLGERHDGNRRPQALSTGLATGKEGWKPFWTVPQYATTRSGLVEEGGRRRFLLDSRPTGLWHCRDHPKSVFLTKLASSRRTGSNASPMQGDHLRLQSPALI